MTPTDAFIRNVNALKQTTILIALILIILPHSLILQFLLFQALLLQIFHPRPNRQRSLFCGRMP
ncbi:hypothetical protein BDZ45DRAFT_676090 [Acephala macrosclerotiorum]|nr:hypothetical protein BDZ45DRAFT_676090 [Acephala macrosclerotiorum]